MKKYLLILFVVLSLIGLNSCKKSNTIEDDRKSVIQDLSAARAGLCGASHKGFILFAGGQGMTNIDIYKPSSNSWSLQHLSVGRSELASGCAGNVVMFAGGSVLNVKSKVVDVFKINSCYDLRY
jgi:hypothetical protein